MNRKDNFLSLWEWECNTTLKILKALPAGMEEIRPDTVGRTAKELGWTVTKEQITFGKLAQSQTDMVEFNLPMPEISWEEILQQFKTNHEVSKKILSELTEDDFENTIIKLPWRDATKEDALMTFMHDMIHHRGQFSVYIRLAGGKVPAIYGTSADDKGQ